jgi:hypothetical protein
LKFICFALRVLLAFLEIDLTLSIERYRARPDDTCHALSTPRHQTDVALFRLQLREAAVPPLALVAIKTTRPGLLPQGAPD